MEYWASHPRWAFARLRCSTQAADIQQTHTSHTPLLPRSLTSVPQLLIYYHWGRHLWVPHQVAAIPRKNVWRSSASALGKQNNNLSFLLPLFQFETQRHKFSFCFCLSICLHPSSPIITSLSVYCYCHSLCCNKTEPFASVWCILKGQH